MPSMIALSLAAALLAVGSAAPTSVGKGFTVKQVPKKSPFIKSGPAAVAAVYKKYNKPVPSNVISAIAATGSVVATSSDQYDSEYLCPVTIGGQTLQLDFDTGSSDL
jgi:aspergillopepsin I